MNLRLFLTKTHARHRISKIEKESAMTPVDYFQVRAEKGKGHDPGEKLFWTTNLEKSDYTLSLDWRCIADREATQGVSQLKGKN